jgi:hypothetical protein
MPAHPTSRSALVTAASTLASAAALAGVLAGCGGPSAPSSGAPSSGAPSSGAPSSGGSAALTPPGGPCRAGELSARLGEPGPARDGARTVPLRYTNTSARVCTLHGPPAIELHGPDDPNGPVFEMSGKDTGATTVTLRPGESATSDILVREDTPDRTGHAGSTGWTPTALVSTPPGDTGTLSTPWTAGGTVLREDSSTHPDEYALPFHP